MIVFRQLCGDHVHWVLPKVCCFRLPLEGEMLREEGPVSALGYGVEISP